MEMILASRCSVLVTLEESSQIGEARRRSADLCQTLGMNETDCGEAAIVVTELATNVIRHGRGGELLLRPVEEEGELALEILALDKGPGMAHLDRAMSDGYSTGGTAGTGLGAVRRLSSEFAVQTAPGAGTAVYALIRKESPPASFAPAPAENRARYGAVSVAMRGEEVCGDAWAIRSAGGRTTVMVADGLGHGLHAAEASREAVRVFNDSPDLAPGELLKRLHGAMRSTRGAAVAVAVINAARSELIYAGAGNVAGVLLTDTASRSLISHNGIVGHEMRRTQEFVYPWEAGSQLIMASDGLTTQWHLARNPELLAKPAPLVAGVLYRDCNRGRDDATVVVVR